MPELATWPAVPLPLFTDPPSGNAQDFTYAVPVSAPRLSSPIAAVSTAYLLQQDFMQYSASYAALALNTAYPTPASFPSSYLGGNPFANFILVEEGPRRDIGGGLVQWTRTYAQVPATHFDPETISYSFIGMTILMGTVYQTRTRQNWRVTSRIQHDYFLVTSSAVHDPILFGLAGGYYGSSALTINGIGDIPVILGMQYVSQGAVGGATYGGLSLAVDSLNVQGVVLPTVPTSDQYLTMISDAQTNRWNGTRNVIFAYPTSTLAGGPPPTSGHAAGVIDTINSILTGGLLPAENSWLERWKGNIYVRRTRYVLAQ